MCGMLFMIEIQCGRGRQHVMECDSRAKRTLLTSMTQSCCGQMSFEDVMTACDLPVIKSRNASEDISI